MEPEKLISARSPGRRRAVNIAALVLVPGIVAYGWWWRSDRDYVGSSREVTLTWECLDHIFWVDPENDELRWWAGSPAAVSHADVSDPDRSLLTAPGSASGVLYFGSRETARFTSYGYWELTLTRQEPGTFYELGCAVS